MYFFNNFLHTQSSCNYFIAYQAKSVVSLLFFKDYLYQTNIYPLICIHLTFYNFLEYLFFQYFEIFYFIFHFSHPIFNFLYLLSLDFYYLKNLILNSKHSKYQSHFLFNP
jgi:hypothetical protein